MIGKRPKISVYIAQSLDGYIARTNHCLDWLDRLQDRSSAEDYGYRAFMDSIDTLVMGRNTYDFVAKLPTWPYAGKRVVVLSTTLATVGAEAELLTGDIAAIMEKLYAEGARHVYVDGGLTASQCICANLVDSLTVSIAPVVLGEGISLFRNIAHERWYALESAHPYPNGLVQLCYRRRDPV